MTQDNYKKLLDEVTKKSVRFTEERLAALSPKPDVVDSVRAAKGNLNEQSELVLAPMESKPKERSLPLSGARFHVNFTVRNLTHEKLKRLKALTGVSMEEIFLAGLEAQLKKHDPALKLALTRQSSSRASKHTRYVSRGMKRALFTKDARCAYVSKEGRRCEATTHLQVDHVRPWAKGGSSKDPENLRLLCRSHNLFLAMQNFGKEYVEKRMRAP